MVDQGKSEEKVGAMKDTPEVSELRQRAEMELEIAPRSTEVVSEMSPEEMAHLIHELQVHQIELNIQNDELHSIQDDLEKTRDRYSHLYDFAPIGYFTLNLKGFIHEANLTFATMLGIERGVLIGQPFSLFVLRDDQDTFYKHRQQLLETEDPQPCGLRLVKKDGQEFYARLEYTVITKEGDNDKQIRAAVSDVTERKQAEETLRESEELHRITIENIQDPVFITDSNGKFTFICPNILHILGYSVTEMEAMGNVSVFMGENQSLFDLEDLNRLGEIPNIEAVIANKNGSKRNYLVTVKRVSIKGGTILYVCRDITERKQAEEALRESEAKYKTIFDLMPVGITVSDNAGNIVETNRIAEKMLGLSKEDHVKRMIDSEEWHIVKCDGSPMSTGEYASTRALKENRLVENVEMGIVKGTDETTWLNVTATHIPMEDHGVAIAYMDISDRKKAEKALHDINETLKEAQSVAKIGSWSYDPVTQTSTWTEEMFHIFGFEPTPLSFPYQDHRKIIYPDDWDRFDAAINRAVTEGIGYDLELRITQPNGDIRYINTRCEAKKDDHGMVKRLVGTAQDITERKKAEEDLHQAHKMEAIGTLAGGIAHDFNNILAIILGNAEMASDDVPYGNPVKDYLNEIRLASVRAKDMVQQLLAFSRKSDEENTPLDMAPIIKESMKMLRSDIPTSVEFKQHISDDPCKVMGDATQINQIVMNLLTNAADAMSEEGGLLEVTLDNIILQKEKPCFHWVLSPGPYVRLGIKDTGEGIEPENMDRIFDPYYTTKEVGKGTGMGLSIIHGIVKRHSGGIRVESALGKGTLFEIYFPALEKAAEEEKEPEGEIRGGSERVLFVDDEESMVNLNRQRLERLGYQVKTTTKPMEALEWFKADPDQFDIIITDMTMPRMTGDRLAAEVLKIRPHVPLIISTGYSERMSAKKVEALGVRKCIEKPIDLRNLASSLREVLDEK